MKPACRLVLLSLLALFPNSTASAADWPTFRGNAQRTGWVREQASPPLTKVWEFQPGGEIMSSPVIAGDVAYIGSRGGVIYALNARTGAQLWQRQTGGMVGASPAVSGGVVYIPSMDGYLYALDRLTGELIWRTGIGSSSVSSPLVLGGRIFVGAGMPGKELKVYDAASGSLLASLPANQPVDGSPAAFGNGIYYGANDGRIYAIDRDSYAALWPAPGYYQTLGSFGVGAVALSSGALYALPGRDEDRVLRLDALTGAQLNVSDPIEATNSWEQAASPVAAGDRLYFAAGASGVSLYALDAQTLQTPSPAWPSAPSLGSVTGFGILSSPAMANEIIYAATTDGRLVAVSSSGASAAADMDISSPAFASPAVSNGMVLVATSGGKLIAYGAARTAAISSPQNDDIVNGVVSVKGYLSNPGLTGYTLEYGPGEEPSSWTNIVSSVTAAAVEGGILAGWDTAGLANGVYTLRLTALESPASGADNTARSALRVNAAPLAPSALSAADVPDDSGNHIRLAWTASSSAGLAAYRIYRDAGAGFVLLASTGAGAVGYTDSSAVTGTTFTYVVRAYDGWLESGDSNSASAYSVNDTGDSVPPARVTDLRAAPGPIPGMAILYWTAPGDDGSLGEAARYQIRYTSAAGHDWNDFDGAAVSASTREVDGPAGIPEAEEVHWLFGGATYYFALKAEDEVPNTGPLSNIATYCIVLDPVPPLPPSALAVADTPGDAGGSLTLSWEPSPDETADTEDVYGYRIYRRVQSSSYASSAPYASVGRGAASYIDPAATANVRFYYSVAAFDSTNDSRLSNEAYGVSADNWRFFDNSQGGTIRLADGTEVEIPGDAANQPDSIMVVRLDPRTNQPLIRLRANTAANPTGITYAVKFQRSDTRLVKPVRITLPYGASAVAGMEQQNLRMYVLDGGAWGLLNTSVVDTGAMKVSAETLHLSTFTIMEYVPSGALLSGESVYTYPNPAKGDTVTFKFYLADKAYVSVDVFNVAGEKVARLEKPNCPAGIVSELAWSVKNIASGVYQYKLEARSASGTKSVMKRLAVIH